MNTPSPTIELAGKDSTTVNFAFVVPKVPDGDKLIAAIFADPVVMDLATKILRHGIAAANAQR